MLQAEVARSRGELHELVAQLRRWIALGKLDRPDESDVQRLDHDGDAVHVMTVHRAKGLEAAVVFVVGGTGGSPPERVHLYHDGGERIAHVGDKDGDTGVLIDRETQEENQRLCYVALTRAKVRLYLWHGATLKSGAPYEPVYTAVGRLIDAHAEGFEVEEVEVGGAPRPIAGAAELAALEDVLEAEWPRAIAPAPLGARAGFEVTSYTQLAHATPDDFRADAEAMPVSVAPTELPAGAETGIFLHEILEHVPFESARATSFADWALLPAVSSVIDAAAATHGITDRAHLDHARDIVWKTLTNPVADLSLPPLCDATKIAREVEFTFPLPGERGFAKGFIDLLVAWDDRVWIVDYKSNVLDELGRGAAEAEVERSYGWQTKLYAIAAQRMIGERDFGARFGGLLFWFVRPQLIVPRRPTSAEVTRWHAELADLPPQRGLR
jgi:exodeoxyribonuclease V beta subunit